MKFKWILLSLMMFGYTACVEPVHYNMNHTLLEGKVRFVDEEGEPIEGAKVEVLFTTTPLQQVDMGKVSFAKHLTTNAEGFIDFHEKALRAGVFPKKEGFWMTTAGIGQRDHHLRQSDDPTVREYWHLRWEETVVMYRKINPRPMYANQFSGNPPKFNETYALDLTANDWVRPHGRGVNRDILFTMEGEARSEESPPNLLQPRRIVEFDVTLTIHFPNDSDGILRVDETALPGSEVALGREAPENDYEGRMTIQRSHTNSGLNEKKPVGYWFRVRSRTDPETGELLGARYGKIIDDVRFGYGYGRDGFEGGIVFKYILSPDEQRSMEYNAENLFPNADWNPRRRSME
ncbi:MAG: hypothetical protein JJU29_13210 [Verrucomicrobia bacterium]|nr:hypothetical protein [Verrucomicrobiota bacterium]MCH8514456.1 hypothetical protein [Kiritimatiellia bacterium]